MDTSLIQPRKNYGLETGQTGQVNGLTATAGSGAQVDMPQSVLTVAGERVMKAGARIRELTSIHGNMLDQLVGGFDHGGEKDRDDEPTPQSDLARLFSALDGLDDDLRSLNVEIDRMGTLMGG